MYFHESMFNQLEHHYSWFCIHKVLNNMVPLEVKKDELCSSQITINSIVYSCRKGCKPWYKSNIVRHNYPLFQKTNAITYWQGRTITGNYQKDNPYGNVLIIRSRKCIYSLSIYLLNIEMTYLIPFYFVFFTFCFNVTTRIFKYISYILFLSLNYKNSSERTTNSLKWKNKSISISISPQFFDVQQGSFIIFRQAEVSLLSVD